MLHVLNGDAVAGPFARSGIPGEATVWADVLHEGPLPVDAPSPRWREARARHAASRGYASYDDARALLERWDAGLERAGDHDEVVLWLEHDLFDQALLVRHLDWFSRRPLRRARLGLVCIGEHPEVPDFRGLGQLSPEQLAGLLDARRPVSDEQLELGRTAWRALTAPDPTGIERLLAADTSALRFLAAALRRHLEELPAVRDGLPRTERQILEAVAAGAATPRHVFRENVRREERAFLGDASFWWRLLELASGPAPLLELDPPATRGPSADPAWRMPLGEVRLTSTGRAVLAGDLDWPRLATLDRWVGGVRIRGREPAWRWDREEGRARRMGRR